MTPTKSNKIKSWTHHKRIFACDVSDALSIESSISPFLLTMAVDRAIMSKQGFTAEAKKGRLTI
jgi:hypothetical protein